MTEILRAGAQKMLAQMIQQEVEDWLGEREHLRDAQDNVCICAHIERQPLNW